MKLKSDIIVKLSEQQFDKIYDAALFLNGGNYVVDGKVDWVCGIGSLPRHFCNLVYIMCNIDYKFSISIKIDFSLKDGFLISNN